MPRGLAFLALLAPASAFRLPEDATHASGGGAGSLLTRSRARGEAAAAAAAPGPNRSHGAAEPTARPAPKWEMVYKMGWLKPREPGRLAYFDVHIAKCAGISWAKDVIGLDVVPRGEGYHSKEVCYYSPGERHAHDFLPGDRMVVLLRQPAAHVYSQFLECKYTEFGRVTVSKNDRPTLASLGTWLRHFDGGREANDLRCYHPYNMQARALSCSSDLNFASHHSAFVGEPSLDVALESVRGAFFVGLVEHYQASLCLFLSKTRATRPLPRHCNCTDKEAWASFKPRNETHKVPPHSVKDIGPQDMALIEELTRMDRKVYDAAWLRFQEEARDLKARTGVQILCPR